MRSVYYIPYRIKTSDKKRPLGLPERGYLRFKTYSEIDAIRHCKDRLRAYNHVLYINKIVNY